MNKNQFYIGEQPVRTNTTPVQGGFIEIDGETFYKISNHDKMDPFLISIVSASDHWMYVSSNGGITAGRKNPDNALFPYCNDDILHDIHEITGSKTIIKVYEKGSLHLWEPFSEKYYGCYYVSRNLYKNITSTKIIFEEINHDLGLTFQYGWTNSDKFGFVKISKIVNHSDYKRKIEILDGIQNILPSGIYQKLQSEFSTLIDGYKKCELIPAAGLGVFSLSSIPSDRAQPSESLTATTVWTAGIDVAKYLMSSKQLSAFRNNIYIEQEENIKGVRGAYFINSFLELIEEEAKSWFITAEVNQNTGDLVSLARALANSNIKDLMVSDFQENRYRLKRIVAQADGIQLTSNKLSTSRHFSNVLFNIMRGGIFDDSYTIEKYDFISFLRSANPYVVNAHTGFLNGLDNKSPRSELLDKIHNLGDSHFIKLALEYLPLTFSRRHGDPSRPWNWFAIDIKGTNNDKVLNYQGNWRDIFQNWEALAFSYPKFLPSMIAKFLNNSTADGYNPYRVNRDGFDWEIQEPHNPWANIGYWGDHQIIYLLKLLELAKEFNPAYLEGSLTEEIFAFANVPYRIKEYEDILNNPRDTIVFDQDLDRRLKMEEERHGSDTKFLKKSDHSLVQVSLIEKLLLTFLVKMSNFIPGGGIWMNTQRPEWNDANNALVGNGISMVTLYYMRRYVSFLLSFLNETTGNNFELSEEVSGLFTGIHNALKETAEKQKDISDRERKVITDKLGTAGSEYRSKIYNRGFTGEKKTISAKMIMEFFELCLSIIDETIKANRRDDGLYHSYNIIHLSGNELRISNLYEMLEGQVAVLSSGYLSTSDSIELLHSLRNSGLYREDQNSYMLYPNKELPLFIEKNNLPKDFLNRSKLLSLLLSEDNREIIYKDIEGGIHFHEDIINSDVLKQKLRNLRNPGYRKYIEDELPVILDIYEEIFAHKEFTGRATTFFKYEGLGSIYWHMVSKLLLAVQEVYLNAVDKSTSKENLNDLRRFYYDIKAGIGTEKSPLEYGAFPTDPYSHTPSFAGAQQPGMTGQVKEDIITRVREIGINIKSGKIRINPCLLRKEEFLDVEGVFAYYDLDGEERKIVCKKDSFAVTCCQVPFIYRLSEKNKIVAYLKDGRETTFNRLEFDDEISQSIFNREGRIDKIEISLSEDVLLN